MRLFLRRLLLVLSVGALLVGRVEADPVVAFSNIPPPGNFKVGGSLLTHLAWKAYLFTTPISYRAEVVSVTVGLTPCIGGGCGGTINPAIADLQIAIYSVSNQSGILRPDTEIYSIPMQNGLSVTGTGTLFTFSVPNWQLSANTTYSLVLKSTLSGEVKWGNIEVGGANTEATAQNGFSLSETAFYTDDPPTNPLWSPTAANNNSVKLEAVLIPAVPTLSEWSQMLLGLMVLSMIGWHFHKQRSY